MPDADNSRIDLRRLTIVALCLTFGLSVVVGQLVRYQILERDKYLPDNPDGQEVHDVEAPTRGRLYDIHGRILAMELYEWYVGMSPPFVTEPLGLANSLSEVLGIPTQVLYEKATADSPWVFVAHHLAYEHGEQALRTRYSGLECTPTATRVYPVGPLTCHLTGIVNEAGVGLRGVEGFYNDLLKPAGGSRLGELGPGADGLASHPGRSNERSGTSLILTIDLNIQYIVADELLQALEEFEAESGSVIVMNPKTGAILASVSYPFCDPMSFAADNLDLLSDPTVSLQWEPGSIFKIITWAAALDSGIITPQTTIYDDGSIEVGGRVIQNWDRRAYGLVTMEDGLVKSLNTVAAYLSTSMGKNRFYTYVRRFGFGSLTGVDFANEVSGMIRTPGDSNWFPSDLGANSFGQGIAVTPIQMVAAVAAVANHGLLIQPHIVHEFVVSEDGAGTGRTIRNEPMIVRRAIPEEVAQTMTALMVEVVESGATRAQVPGYRVAGKTGTAQVPTPYGYHPTDTIASFVGFAPADDPQFIVLVKLDKPRASPWGSQTAAPTFAAIAERLLRYLQIPPDSVRVAQLSPTP